MSQNRSKNRHVNVHARSEQKIKMLMNAFTENRKRKAVHENAHGSDQKKKVKRPKRDQEDNHSFGAEKGKEKYPSATGSEQEQNVQRKKK